MASATGTEMVEAGTAKRKRIFLPVAGMAAGAALLVWWGMRRKQRARGGSEDRKRARELQRDWKRAASS